MGIAALALFACGESEARREEAQTLPPEWEGAEVDARTGGRYLADRRQELLHFQEAVVAGGGPVLYPHYADPGTVVLAIKSSFIEATIRRRLHLLLTSEGPDSELEVLAITDAPAAPIESRLGLGDLPAWKRVTLTRAPLRGESPPTFPFIRDYAPLVLARPGAGGFRASGLVVFGGSNLNKVVDRELGVNLYRNLNKLRERLKLTRHLASLYERKFPGIPIHPLETVLDGGNLITDGRGTCFLTEIVLDKNDGRPDAIRRDLAEHAGCHRSVFLEAPDRLDFVQHVDTLLYFADAQNAILSMPTLYPSDRESERRNAKTLLDLGYKVHLVPRRTASITYANILTTRRNVYVPQYTGYLVETEEALRRRQRIESLDRTLDRDLLEQLLRRPTETRTVRGDAHLEADNRRALDVVRALHPEKNVVAVESDETLGSLGSWHCLAHELP